MPKLRPDLHFADDELCVGVEDEEKLKICTLFITHGIPPTRTKLSSLNIWDRICFNATLIFLPFIHKNAS